MLCWPFRLWLPVGWDTRPRGATPRSVGSEEDAPRKDGDAGKDQGYWSEECLNAAAVTRRKIENAAHARPDGKAGRHQHAHRKDDHLHALRLCHAAIMAPREA